MGVGWLLQSGLVLAHSRIRLTADSWLIRYRKCKSFTIYVTVDFGVKVLKNLTCQQLIPAVDNI